MSLINIENLTFSYDGNPDLIFENVSLKLDTRWKLGLIGRNGRGKTTFLKLLIGEYKYIGNISASTSFDYFPFDTKDDSLNTIDIVRSISPKSEDWEINKELFSLNVSPDILYACFNTLSSGEKTKVLLASLFLKPNNF
ncbi:MAG: ATP-binding cassette domain-containing protein, partial [Oscillospiraceae bacterium]|nr:ATP-binding cassette domain-containing protein [Oscillospiraceae bacterium]